MVLIVNIEKKAGVTIRHAYFIVLSFALSFGSILTLVLPAAVSNNFAGLPLQMLMHKNNIQLLVFKETNSV